MTINYLALKGLCARRMCFSEQPDTVATAWSCVRALSYRFPLLAAYLKPTCDWSGKCNYHKKYALSEAFGCLFKECGRNECEAKDDYAEFSSTCTDKEDIKKLVGPEFFKWVSIKDQYHAYFTLSSVDRILLGEDE